MSRRWVVLTVLFSKLFLGACQAAPNWNDLTSRQLYSRWDGLTPEEAVARCDSVSNRELRGGEVLYAAALRSGPDSETARTRKTTRGGQALVLGNIAPSDP